MLEGCRESFPPGKPWPMPLKPIPEIGGKIGGDPAPEDPAPIGESAPPLDAALEGDLEMSEEPEGEGGELTRLLICMLEEEAAEEEDGGGEEEERGGREELLLRRCEGETPGKMEVGIFEEARRLLLR